MDYERLMKRARRANKLRDSEDRAAGYAPPHATGPIGLLRTAMMAIESGLSTLDREKSAALFRESCNCIAEGQAMLEDLLSAFETLLHEGVDLVQPVPPPTGHLRLFDPACESDEAEEASRGDGPGGVA